MNVAGIAAGVAGGAGGFAGADVFGGGEVLGFASIAGSAASNDRVRDDRVRVNESNDRVRVNESTSEIILLIRELWYHFHVVRSRRASLKGSSSPDCFGG